MQSVSRHRLRPSGELRGCRASRRRGALRAVPRGRRRTLLPLPSEALSTAGSAGAAAATGVGGLFPPPGRAALRPFFSARRYRRAERFFLSESSWRRPVPSSAGLERGWAAAAALPARCFPAPRRSVVCHAAPSGVRPLLGGSA